jgi:uncharacterized protein (DUF488 family)
MARTQWGSVDVICHMQSNREIWTIGHSNKSEEDFLKILKVWDIEVLVDIRTLPGSRRYPYFNKEAFEVSLPAANIRYMHMPELGGRRKPLPDSINSVWKNASFRGYADYMQSQEFKKAMDELEKIGLGKRTAYMCSEALWWKCHRALVSDYLKTRGWKVIHIQDESKSQEHPYTSPAKPVQGQLFYN